MEGEGVCSFLCRSNEFPSFTLMFLRGGEGEEWHDFVVVYDNLHIRLNAVIVIDFVGNTALV